MVESWLALEDRCLKVESFWLHRVAKIFMRNLGEIVPDHWVSYRFAFTMLPSPPIDWYRCADGIEPQYQEGADASRITVPVVNNNTPKPVAA